MEKIKEIIVEEVWGKWIGIPIIVIASIIMGIKLVSMVRSEYSYSITEGNVTHNELTAVGFWISIAIIICILALNL